MNGLRKKRNDKYSTNNGQNGNEMFGQYVSKIFINGELFYADNDTASLFENQYSEIQFYAINPLSTASVFTADFGTVWEVKVNEEMITGIT